MALNIIKPEVYAGLFVAALEREVVLPGLITRFDGGRFKGAKDDTINFKLRRVAIARDYEFRTRITPITLDDITQVTISIKLDTHTVSAVPITDEELTLDVTSFAEEIVIPQTEAIVEKLEPKIASALAAAPFGKTDFAFATADDPYKRALQLRRQLNSQKAPKGQRYWVVGANVEQWILESDRISKPEFSESTSALRDAVSGRIAGFTVVSTSEIGDNDFYAFHPSALVLANVAPEVPSGVSYGARRSSGGYSMRVIRDYDSNYLRDRSVVNTFTGISSVNDAVDSAGALTGKNPRGVRGAFTP